MSDDAIIRGRYLIADLVCDPRFQMRAKLDPGTISRYASVYKAEVEMPPIRVAVVNGVPLVVDGWHRIAALERISTATVDAEVSTETEQAALWLAAKANLDHGLALKPAEHRNVFRAYVRANQNLSGKTGLRLKSYREIASELGGVRQYTTIRSWMIKDFPATAERMGGNDAFKGAGGLPETLPAATFYDEAVASLDATLKASQGISDKRERGRLIAGLEELLQQIKDAGPWDAQAAMIEEDQLDF